MTRYCNNCGKPLPTSDSKFCSECGAKQTSTHNISTTVGRDIKNSTLINAETVNMNGREAIVCPDCFGTGIKHVDCPNCNGTGLIEELIPREYTEQQKKAWKDAEKFVTSKKEDSLKGKAISTAGNLMILAAMFMDADKEKKYESNKRNYREVTCPICDGKKYLPINHEENLKLNKIRNIPACDKCDGAKKIYLSD